MGMRMWGYFIYSSTEGCEMGLCALGIRAVRELGEKGSRGGPSVSAQRGGSRWWLGARWAEARQPIPAFIPQYLNIWGKSMAPARVPSPLCKEGGEWGSLKPAHLEGAS